MTMRLKVAPSMPFLVENGSQFELHRYAFDDEGRRWEETVEGPFETYEIAELALDALLTRGER